ncbi:MAG: acyl-ACP--UDP-N-acetylglucosamine O-acyltransferase [Verrucomicrobiaceae bacterium]|nr:acyl-ACP--UDP-N-acetylglucosamine O-acyltransferase [Verrucomicrobiaceae bacterium]
MIHPTALIDARAQIHPSVSIGAYAVIEGPVQLAANVIIGAHAHVLGDTIIGQGTKIGRAAIIGEDPQDLSFDPATPSLTIIGENNVIREQVTIHRGSKPGSATRLGDNNFLMANSHLGHDVQIGNRNVAANGVLLAGHVHIGNNSFLGGGSAFHQFIHIGDFCIIQGNAVMTKDVPHYCATNSLNRITGLNVIGMRRQGFSTADRAQIKELFNLVFRSGRNRLQAIAAARKREWPAKCEHFLQFIEAPSKRGICSMRVEVKKLDDEE